MYENNFLYLFDVKKLTSLNYDNLKKYYVNLESFLKPIIFFDLDGIDLFLDLKVLQVILPKEKKTVINILNFIKELNCSKCISCCVAYRILLTILVTVASVERSFSKFKL
jgi:hypothetical protein